MRYSVIIPIYNAEKTLNRCLDSLLCQKRADMELILINDGSADQSEIICREYAEKSPAIKIYSVPNGGVSRARNIGLSVAIGDYILFVDSDDYVDENYFDTLDQLTADPSVDFGMFGSRHFGARNFDSRVIPGEWKNDEVSAAVSDWMKRQLLNSLWSKVYRREIVEDRGLQFDESLSVSEDLSFVFAYALAARHAVCIEDVLYYVSEENEGSLSRGRRPNLAGKLLRADQVMRSALRSADLSPEAEHKLVLALNRNYYRSAYSAAKQWKNETDTKKRRYQIQKICNAFSQGKVPIDNIENFLIAFPVERKLTVIVDLMIQYYH